MRIEENNDGQIEIHHSNLFKQDKTQLKLTLYNTLVHSNDYHKIDCENRIVYYGDSKLQLAILDATSPRGYAYIENTELSQSGKYECMMTDGNYKKGLHDNQFLSLMRYLFPEESVNRIFNSRFAGKERKYKGCIPLEFKNKTVVINGVFEFEEKEFIDKMIRCLFDDSPVADSMGQINFLDSDDGVIITRNHYFLRWKLDYCIYCDNQSDIILMTGNIEDIKERKNVEISLCKNCIVDIVEKHGSVEQRDMMVSRRL
jgi:hypothetical protein